MAIYFLIDKNDYKRLINTNKRRNEMSIFP